MAIRTPCIVAIVSIAITLIPPSRSFALGGTDVVATAGAPVTASAAWPEGVAAIVNDRMRTSGWNSWFSEWPNDVNQYAFEIESTADVNRLLEKLAATESAIRQVKLSPLKEPKALGWVTSLPEGNNIAVIFSVGDQSRIDEWFKRVRMPFGVMEFTAAPTAVPPTLTLFVGNQAVKLDELKIPMGITVSAGYIPTVFHRFNTKEEKRREEEAASKPPSIAKEVVDAETQAAIDAIEAFIKARAK